MLYFPPHSLVFITGGGRMVTKPLPNAERPVLCCYQCCSFPGYLLNSSFTPFFWCYELSSQTRINDFIITWPHDAFENPDNQPSTLSRSAQTPALLLLRFKGILNFTTSIVSRWPSPGSERKNPTFNNCCYRTLLHLLKPLHVTAWILICCLNGKQLITIHKLPQARLRH